MKIEKFLSASWLYSLFRTYDVVIGDFQKQLADEGVHFLQALVLTSLFFEERPVRPSEFAKTLGVERSNISHALRALERKKWIERKTSDIDARAYFFALTKEGKRKVPRLIKLFDVTENKLEASSKLKGLVPHLRNFAEVYRAQRALKS